MTKNNLKIVKSGKNQETENISMERERFFRNYDRLRHGECLHEVVLDILKTPPHQQHVRLQQNLHMLRQRMPCHKFAPCYQFQNSLADLR